METVTKKIRMTALALAVASSAATVAPSRASAQAQPTVEGVWRVTRHGVNCQTGQTVATFPALMTFHKDGTVSGDAVPPGGSPAQGTVEQGTWRREPGAQSYSFRLLSYSRDVATGALQSSIEVTGKLQLTSNDSFAYETVIQFFDSQGHPVSFPHCGQATGTRFE